MRIVNLVENTAGADSCGYEHGLSFYVETERHRLLVDSGATDLFLHNAETLGIDLRQVDAMVLSHGHYDHGGGIPAFVKINPHAKIYMQRSAAGDYYHIEEDLEKYIGLDKKVMHMPQTVFVDGDQKLDEELYLFSGIQKRNPVSAGNLKLKRREGDSYVQDDFGHEQCLVITQDQRHILMSGCAHNGILNIMDRYYEIFHEYPDMVISGFHMKKHGAYGPEEQEEIRKTAEALADTHAVFYTGHCTGQQAYEIMKEIMGDQLMPIHSGMEIFISAQIREENELLSDAVKKLLEVMEYDIPYTSKVLMEKLGLRSREGFRRNYLHPAIELNLVRMTIPDKPNSRNQRYMKA